MKNMGGMHATCKIVHLEYIISLASAVNGPERMLTLHLAMTCMLICHSGDQHGFLMTTAIMITWKLLHVFFIFLAYTVCHGHLKYLTQ